MKDFFSSSEMAWVAPVFTVCALIILLAAWALRREIAQLFRNFFFPKEQRYTLAQPILKQGQSQRNTAQKKEIIPQPKGDYVPSQFTIIDKAQFTSNLQGYKPPKDMFNFISTISRWHWRKVKRLFPKQQPVSVAPPEPQKPKPPKVMKAAVPAPPAPPGKKQQQNKPLTSERALFIFIMVVLSFFIIFLGAQVSKLSTAVEKQNAYIQDMQNKMHPQPKRVVIYDIPMPKK